MLGCLIALGVGLGPAASVAAVIGFDDITTRSFAPVPGTYAGFSWSRDWMVISDASYMGAFGNSYGSPSGNYAAFNDEPFVRVTATTDFSFVGAFFSGFANFDLPAFFTASAVRIQGFDDGVQVANLTSPTLPTDSYLWVAAGFEKVDELRLIGIGGGGAFFLMDNFTWGPAQVPAVPEPGVVALFGPILLGMAIHRWRRKALVPPQADVA